MNDGAQILDDYDGDTDEPTHVSVRPKNKPQRAAADTGEILQAEIVGDTDLPVTSASEKATANLATASSVAHANSALIKPQPKKDAAATPVTTDAMAEKLSARNRALARYLLVPLLLVTVALLGGLRVGAADKGLIFLPPALVTLFMALLLVLLFVRGLAIDLRAWFAPAQPLPALIAHAVTLLTLFFASAQTFNSVLPESGLLHWLFAFCFLWTLWQNQFAGFDARRLLKSLAVLFGTAFALKYVLLNNLNAGAGDAQTWKQKLVGLFLEGVSLGTLDLPTFAPATGYIAFFTLAIYLLALIVLVSSTTINNDRS